jgi:hypothetical protein
LGPFSIFDICCHAAQTAYAATLLALYRSLPSKGSDSTNLLPELLF